MSDAFIDGILSTEVYERNTMTAEERAAKKKSIFRTNLTQVTSTLPKP